MRTCDSCDFSVKLEGDADGLFECRRHAIRVVGIDDDGEVASAFPVCKPDMWCGEWEYTPKITNPNNYAMDW